MPALRLLMGSTGEVDLAGVFRHVDDLAYTARSSDVGVAAVEVVGDTVRVAAAGLGSATITVTAAAADGQQALQIFNVTVRGAVQTAAALAEVSVVVGGIAEIDLADRFLDADNEALAYAARSSHAEVAAVSIVNDGTLRVVALVAGRAEVVVSATDSDATTAESAFAVVVAEPEVDQLVLVQGKVVLDASGESRSVNLLQLFPHMDLETTVTSQSSTHVVATHVQNQELLLVPGKNEGVSEVVVTAAHGSGWRTTYRLQVAVEPALRPGFRGWRMVLLHDAANAETDSGAHGQAVPASP